MPPAVAMQPYPPQQSIEPESHSHRGPLSRTWPQLFKKRRRYSPVRESAQSQAQAQAVPQTPVAAATAATAAAPPLQQDPQPQPQLQHHHHHFQASVPLRPQKQPSLSAPSIRSPSITASTASTISTISEISSPASQHQTTTTRVPIARRTSSITTTDTNLSGGVATPTADLLASKSNYELISSGQHLEMGLHFSTAMATGVMMKRATHRAAEQARRDRMKTAMVDLAEFLLDGEVTFGSGTTCFVVMRGGGESEGGLGDGGSVFSEASGVSGLSGLSEGSMGSLGSNGKGRPGEKKTVNKARLIEMALEKMRAQEREIEVLRREVEVLRCASGEGEDGDKGERMDES